MTSKSFKVAAVQIAPVFLNREATIDKVCGHISSAALSGAKLIVLPEAMIPAYPDWVWMVPPRERDDRQAICRAAREFGGCPSEATGRLCRAARESAPR